MCTGGLGEYLEVADTVILVENFQLADATGRARELVAGQTVRHGTGERPLRLPLARCPLPRGIGGVKGRGLRAEVRGREVLAIGRDTVDLRSLPQLVDPAQARAVGDAILYAVERDIIDGQATVAEVVNRVLADIATSGLGVLGPQGDQRGDYAMPRAHEIAAVLNRLRSLQVRTRRPGQAPGAGTDEAPPATPGPPGAGT
jgi:predicted ABC-class ATPase